MENVQDSTVGAFWHLLEMLVVAKYRNGALK